MRWLLISALTGGVVWYAEPYTDRAKVNQAFEARDEALREIAALLEVHEAKIRALEEKQ